MNDKYILVDKEPVVETDLMSWGKWFGTADRHIKKDNINDVEISTVFLGLDHSFGGTVPILFETMVFGGEYDQEQERYATYKQAEIGHNRWVDKVKGS